MRTFIKPTLLATAVLALGVLGASAQTVTYKVVPRALTAAELATYNQVIVAPASPYAGWAVISADNEGVGLVTYSAPLANGDLAYFGMSLNDGRIIQINNGVKAIQDGVIQLRFTEAELLNAVNSVPVVAQAAVALPYGVVALE